MTDVDPGTRLGAATISQPLGAVSQNVLTSFRAVPQAEQRPADNLGVLQDLPGFWAGSGFNLIARPDFERHGGSGIFLELNMMQETLEFTAIGSPVVNRGDLQDDIVIFGVSYLHRITDTMTGGALHIEPGMWLNVPSTTAPEAKGSIVRLATIPHGSAVSAVGEGLTVVFDKVPEIPPANTVPFEIGGAVPVPGTKHPFVEYDLSVECDSRSDPLPPGVDQAIVNDPNVLLRRALDGQTLTHITRLVVSTTPAGGVGNIPFLVQNANAASLESAFAIERVKGQAGLDFLQLQYSQTVLLNFGGLSFPHVTVGTLVKAF